MGSETKSQVNERKTLHSNSDIYFKIEI